jgi:hypothetical protein
MRWLAAATILAVLVSGLNGCEDSEGPTEPGGEAGGFAEGGNAGHVARAGAENAAAGRTGHAGAGHAGSVTAGQSNSGSAGEGTAGGATAGTGGATAGTGGATAGTGGATAGTGGATAGTGGATAGTGGATAGTGGATAGTGGATAGTGGATAGTGGATAGTGGTTAGTGGGPPSVPAPPTTFFAHVQSTTSISIRWNDNATDETGYYVYWSTTGIKPATPNATITGDAAGLKYATAEGLTSNTLYYFWIEAYNASGSSSALTGTATPGLVPEFTGLRLNFFDTATKLSFTWDDSVGETGYHVYLGTPSLPQPPTPVHDLPANTVSFTFPTAEITPYTNYSVWISAYNAIGDGGASWSGPVAVGTKPAAPKSLSVNVSMPSFTISGSWQEGSPNTSYYNVYWSADGNQYGGPQPPAVATSSVDGNTHSSTLKQVIGGQFYHLWVEAGNVIGTSYAVETIATTKTTDLSWRELWFDNDTQNVHLAVDDTFGFVNDADPQTELNVYQSGTSWTSTMGAPTPVGPSGSFLWNATTLSIDTSKPHYFWIEAKNSEGTLLSRRNLDPGNPVTNLVATASTNSVSLTWDVTPFAQGYRVYTSKVNFFDQAILTNVTNATSATVTGLLPGTHYAFFVRSVAQGFGGGAFLGNWEMVEATTTGP